MSEPIQPTSNEKTPLEQALEILKLPNASFGGIYTDSLVLTNAQGKAVLAALSGDSAALTSPRLGDEPWPEDSPAELIPVDKLPRLEFGPFCGCCTRNKITLGLPPETQYSPFGSSPVGTSVPLSPSMPKRERPQKTPDKSGVQYLRELSRYCGLRWEVYGTSLPPCRELEDLFEKLADAQDDALRLHHAYCDLKYPQGPAQETKPDAGIPHPRCNYLAPTGGVCNKCGWADPKGRQTDCGNPVMVGTEWYGPCTKPSGHDGECSRETFRQGIDRVRHELRELGDCPTCHAGIGLEGKRIHLTGCPAVNGKGDSHG